MTIQLPTAQTRPDDTATSSFIGLRCRACGHTDDSLLGYVCTTCLGPLDADYDFDALRLTVSAARIGARPSGIWRYGELLPVAQPARGLPVGSTPLLRAERLGEAIGLERLWLKDDTRNPTLSFKDRNVAVAAARAVELGLPVLACASTGNLAAATAGAAAVVGLPALVLVPADLEPEKIDHALAYGASVVPVRGTYDEVNRVCLELADETGWGFVNVNLRPYYAEGSKTLAFEIAEQLGWRTPDVVVAPIASGALFTKLARGFAQLALAGLIEARPVRFVGAQAAGCAPVADAFAAGADAVRPVRQPDTIVHSLAIGAPADGAHALALARGSGGSIEAVPDQTTAAAIRLVAATEGIYAETAGGVTVAAARAALERGTIAPDDEVVVLLTGQGLKTPEARWLGQTRAAVPAGRPGLAEPVPPRAEALLDELLAVVPPTEAVPASVAPAGR
jgi:threonine synthase